LYQCRTISQFNAELDWLLKRFNPISLSELHARVAAGEPIPPGSLFVSFDDGLRECIDIVAPICRAKGIPATFFISTGFTDNRSLFYRHKASLLAEACLQSGRANALRINGNRVSSYAEFRAFVFQVRWTTATQLDDCAEQLDVCFEEYLRTQRPYLDSEDISTLIRQGFSIGGHSVDHPLYSEIPLEAQIDQTRDCLRDLKSKFPLAINSFAFPFLADGVAEQFMERALSSERVDLVFYTGALRPDHGGRVIWRFGAEEANRSFARTWKRNVGRQQMDRIARFLKPVAR